MDHFGLCFYCSITVTCVYVCYDLKVLFFLLMDLFFFFFFVNGFCSFADLQKPQTELDGKACAGVGQSSLMAYYETMFDQVMRCFFFLVVS